MSLNKRYLTEANIKRAFDEKGNLGIEQLFDANAIITMDAFAREVLGKWLVDKNDAFEYIKTCS